MYYHFQIVWFYRVSLAWVDQRYGQSYKRTLYVCVLDFLTIAATNYL